MSFASYYGSHMVLQQAPKRAQIWGYAENSQIGQSVELEVNHTSNSYRRVYTTSVVRGNTIQGRQRLNYGNYRFRALRKSYSNLTV